MMFSQNSIQVKKERGEGEGEIKIQVLLRLFDQWGGKCYHLAHNRQK